MALPLGCASIGVSNRSQIFCGDKEKTPLEDVHFKILRKSDGEQDPMKNYSAPKRASMHLMMSARCGSAIA
jgi:hypothetical protein